MSAQASIYTKMADPSDVFPVAVVNRDVVSALPEEYFRTVRFSVVRNNAPVGQPGGVPVKYSIITRHCFDFQGGTRLLLEAYKSSETSATELGASTSPARFRVSFQYHCSRNGFCPA
jgi:hypothetical protein